MKSPFNILTTVFTCVTFNLFHPSTQKVSTDPNDISFYLYPNAENKNDTEVLIFGEASSITSSRYEAQKSLIILIHGFVQDHTSVFPQVVKNAYLAAGIQKLANIVAVDGGKLGTPTGTGFPWDSKFLNVPLRPLLMLLEYFAAANNVRWVGHRVSDFIGFFHENNFVNNLDNVHIVGMSLGAHVAGATGAFIQKRTNGVKIARITGLDPAGPGFQNAHKSIRLDASDAKYVDSIHTDEAVFGYSGGLGTADYFANRGGLVQPGCDLFAVDAIRLFCSHGKAIYYFAKSIQDHGLKGCKISPDSLLWFAHFGHGHGQECTTFGENSPTNASGNYYIRIETTELGLKCF